MAALMIHDDFYVRLVIDATQSDFPCNKGNPLLAATVRC